jgi:hypothetical protein
MAVTTGYNLPYDSAKLIEPKLYINGYCVLAGVLTWIVNSHAISRILNSNVVHTLQGPTI